MVETSKRLTTDNISIRMNGHKHDVDIINIKKTTAQHTATNIINFDDCFTTKFVNYSLQNAVPQKLGDGNWCIRGSPNLETPQS